MPSEGSLKSVPVTAKEIGNIIRSFKNGKAQDIHGLAAEHMKYATDKVCILTYGYISPMMLEGLCRLYQRKTKM